jgi:hypothetical protein
MCRFSTIFPAFFVKIISSHGPLVALLQATARLRFTPAQHPGALAPLRFVGQLPPEEAKQALQLAESTAPVPPGEPSVRGMAWIGNIIDTILVGLYGIIIGIKKKNIYTNVYIYIFMRTICRFIWDY